MTVGSQAADWECDRPRWLGCFRCSLNHQTWDNIRAGNQPSQSESGEVYFMALFLGHKPEKCHHRSVFTASSEMGLIQRKHLPSDSEIGHSFIINGWICKESWVWIWRLFTKTIFLYLVSYYRGLTRNNTHCAPHKHSVTLRIWSLMRKDVTDIIPWRP